MGKRLEPERCPEALRHDYDPDGRCHWCNHFDWNNKWCVWTDRYVLPKSVQDEQELAYGYHWDPDFGVDRLGNH